MRAALRDNPRMATMHYKDLGTHTVYQLYAIGTRYAVGFTPEDAVDRYMELHPDADRLVVEKELVEEMQKQQW
jgi:hypothetical protein